MPKRRIDRQDEAQITLNRFVASVNEKIATSKAPQEVIKHPLLIGQVAYEITGGCSVYLMSAPEASGDGAYVKIGVARNIAKRISAIAIGCPLHIKRVIYFCVTGYQRAFHLERHLHQAFDNCRIRGEWFYFAKRQELAEILPQIIACAEEKLGDDFNQFTYDPAQTQHPALPAVTFFAKAIWGLSDDNAENDAMMAEIVKMTASSQERYENIQMNLAYRACQKRKMY
jgi:hypothetical protein